MSVKILQGDKQETMGLFCLNVDKIRELLRRERKQKEQNLPVEYWRNKHRNRSNGQREIH